MSALAGFVHWDGRAVADVDLARFTAYSRSLGPHRSGTARPIPSVALQAHVVHFDKYSAAERQPYVFDQGSVLTWDGRLDNRDDLLLTLHHDLGPERSDAALVAAAYARWDLDCLPRLLGDWSLALWDGRRQRLVLARDYIGLRPLYYVERPQCLAWATSLDALAASFDLYAQPNDHYVAGKLAAGVPPDQTCFRGALALRAGHLLTGTATHGVSVRRYWAFEPRTIRYRDPRNYTEHLRSLLSDAVRVRLRANRPVWAHLSGGWDSSSVVCLAHGLMQGGDTEAPRLHALSGIFSVSRESDETQYIAAVERWCGLTSNRCDWEGLRMAPFKQLLGYRAPFPNVALLLLERPVQTAGDHVVLSGSNGDLVMGQGVCHRVSPLEPLYEGRLLRWLQMCFELSRQTHRPLRDLLVWPLLWGHLSPQRYQKLAERRAARLVRGTPREYEFGSRNAMYAGLTSSLIAHIPHRELPSARLLSAFPAVKRPFVVGLYSFINSSVMTNPITLPGVCRTYPYTHRPLVEFMLGIPQSAFWTPEVPRAGMRTALHDVLPPEVRARTEKSTLDVAETRADRAWALDLLESRALLGAVETWQIVVRHYIEPAAVTEALEALRVNETPPERLRKWIGLEAWLRTIAALPRQAAPDDLLPLPLVSREPSNSVVGVA